MFSEFVILKKIDTVENYSRNYSKEVKHYGNNCLIV